MRTSLTIREAARLCGKDVPDRGRCYCPVREHKRQDKTASVFRADSGDMLIECFSCDAPDNVWDAVGLYAALSGMERRAAWRALKDQGYAVPGLREDGATVAPAPAARVKAEDRPMPLEGRSPARVLELPPEQLDRFVNDTDPEVLRAFGAQRHLPFEFLMREGVLTVRTRVGTAVGFVYRDPVTKRGCRVKFKFPEPPEKGSPYFVRPTGDPDEDGIALAPLYGAERIIAGKPALIQEGEVDALTLQSLDLPNVVSLPDGVDCAKHCDLLPIAHATPWIICTDADPPGDRAAATLMKRASAYAIDAVRVRWTRLSDDGGLSTAKDANEARQRGYTREDFVRCIQLALTERYGFDPGLIT